MPLARIDGPPEPVFRRCREIIDSQAKPEEQANLLAVTEVLAGLRYNDPQILSLLGGKQIMIESPVLRDFLAEELHLAILGFLEGRFGKVPEEVIALLKTINDRDRLQQIAKNAAKSPDLDSFRKQLIP